MQQLSPHFMREEFELDGPMPNDAVTSYTASCNVQLEPIRAQFDRPMEITSGYRNPSANEKAHGVSTSQHEATQRFCATDFKFPIQPSMRVVFDWIRTSGKIPYDQLILEHNPETKNDIIHISWTESGMRQQAMEGDTANLEAYTQWPSTKFVSTQNV